MISSPPEFVLRAARPDDAEAVLELVPPELGFGLDDIRNEWRMTDLARQTNATLPRLSHVVKRLEGRGLIERFPCPEDRRATNALILGQLPARIFWPSVAVVSVT